MENRKINSYKDLVVWQKSMSLTIEIYRFTSDFPKEEIYGLVSQMRRCAVSIPSNIAEGSKRGSKKDFRHFLLCAFGSGAELETQIEIAKRLDFGSKERINVVCALLSETMKMLSVFIKKTKIVSHSTNYQL